MKNMVFRFSLRQRLEHFSIMVIFIVLAVTGFPQKFFEAGWARWTLDALGGVDHARLYHRWAGILFAVLAVVHIVAALIVAISSRSGWSMVPTRKDFTDAVTMLRYYLGLDDQHAQFDRYDYRQKFEYWGLILGGVVMVLTGFILYFPLEATRFLPGEVIPASKVAHGNEGLLAFLVVILWHIYNAHLSPDVFPFDSSIFTGRISRERMVHEHPLEYARLSGTKGAPPSHHGG